MLPVLGRKVVERQQTVTILCQLLDGFRIFRLIRCHELLECLVCLGARGGHPDRLQASLCAGLLRRWQGIHHIAHLVKPAALRTGRRKHFFQGRPKAHRAIAGGKHPRESMNQWGHPLAGPESRAKSNFPCCFFLTAGFFPFADLFVASSRTRFLIIGYDRVVPVTHVDQAVVQYSGAALAETSPQRNVGAAEMSGRWSQTCGSLM
jgi:hypothetical protein